jgi:hypothetical protein
MSKHSRERAEAARRRQRLRRLWLIGGLAAVVVLAGALTVWGLTSRSQRSAEGPVVRSSEDIQRIAPLEAKALLDRGEAQIYDVRVRSSYEAKHAAGALALPEAELADLAPSLPKDTILILYCT